MENGSHVSELDLIAVAELADELGTYRATIFKIVKRLGFQPVKRRDSERGGQQIALVTAGEATAIREAFTTGRRSGDEASPDAVPFAADEGTFDEVLALGDRFFSVMPSVGVIPEEDDEETITNSTAG